RDCLEILERRLGPGGPPLTGFVENPDLSDDAWSQLPGRGADLGVPVWRGLWLPPWNLTPPEPGRRAGGAPPPPARWRGVAGAAPARCRRGGGAVPARWRRGAGRSVPEELQRVVDEERRPDERLEDGQDDAPEAVGDLDVVDHRADQAEEVDRACAGA